MTGRFSKLVAAALGGHRSGELPSSYRILPYEVEHRIPGFESMYRGREGVLAPTALDCAARFRHFAKTVIDARGSRYLPVCRMSDGEFLFALGRQPADERAGAAWRLLDRIYWSLADRRDRGHFRAGAAGRYASGSYSRTEWQEHRAEFGRDVAAIAAEGIIAPHLSFGEVPFQERYFPAFGRWLATNGIVLSDDNYVPFYCVYALLAGELRGAVLNGRVLVVNGASGEKRERIIEGLRREGASHVRWLHISTDRSLLDVLDVAPYRGEVEIALVGAGIGKARVLRQLAPLGVPCIDAGFMFEVWADPAAAVERPFCLPDEGRP
jgi:hypothetical protein